MLTSRMRPLIGTCIGTLLILFMVHFFAFSSLPSADAANQAGYHDTHYPNTIVGESQYPTGEKPQSKLWFNDGRWWAVMYSETSKSFTIFVLNWPNEWRDTGTRMDERGRSRADALWDGTHLYVVSSVFSSYGSEQQGGRLYRYSYNPVSKIYTLDSGFPSTVMTGLTETIVLDKDSTGKLWVTFTQSNKVYVNSSGNDGATWGTPFVVPGAANIYPDDISALVAYHDSGTRNAVGVVWSSHNTVGGAPDPTAALYFAFHRDGDPDSTWQIKLIYQGRCVSDDHINLKSLQADENGRIYAAVKTSLADSGCSTPGNKLTPTPKRTDIAQIRLLVINSTGLVQQTVFSTYAENHTRPIVLLDPGSDKLYMFATSPTEGGGAIYMKTTSMSNPNFSNELPPMGTTFISNPQGMNDTHINNATSTKQMVSGDTGLVVLASDQTNNYYVHGTIGQPAVPTATATATQTATPTRTATATAIQTATPTRTATTTQTASPSTTPTATVTTQSPASREERIYLPAVMR